MKLSISTIIPTYNRARLLERAVRSALAAGEPGDEVIVVDDGSTDGTEQAIAPYRYRVRYERTNHCGAGGARNRGIAVARNPLVAFLDSDDEFLPWRLDLARRLLEARPDVLFCTTDFRSDHGESIVHKAFDSWQGHGCGWGEVLGPPAPYSSLAALPAGWPDFDCYIGDLYPAQMTASRVCTFTTTVRREESGAALHFPEGVPTFEDWWCFSCLARLGPGAYLDCETAIQHCHKAPRLTDAGTLDCANTKLRMLEAIWGADPAFLGHHRAEYEREVATQRLRRAKGLLMTGSGRDARAELSRIQGAPAAYRALSALPGPLLAALFEARRRVQSAS